MSSLPPDSESTYGKILQILIFFSLFIYLFTKCLPEAIEHNSCSGPQIFHTFVSMGLLRVPIFDSETEPLEHRTFDEPRGLPEGMRRLRRGR